MSDNHYRGEVTLDLNGDKVTLKFTWGSRAVLCSLWGDNWVERSSKAIATLNPMDLATMLDSASIEPLDIGEILAKDWSLLEVAKGIREAFKYSHHGLSEPVVEDKERPNVMKPQKTPFLQNIKRRLGLA